MSDTADVIIIGAGVIGAAVAYELAKQGKRTLTLERNAQAGHGSTAGSCAIIRMHYSTFDGTAFAWEGYHYWRDWADYLEAPDADALARFIESGCLVMKTAQNGMLAQHMKNSAALSCPFEEWSAEQVTAKLPIYQLDSFAPARRIDDPAFGTPNGGRLTGGVYWPHAGYVTDPALSAQNLMAAAKRHGARLRLGAEVAEILQSGGRVSGVRLTGGEEIHAPVVINVAGPASSKINAMAGVLDDMTITTRALRQEVVHVPAPAGFDFEAQGTIVSDSDIALYCRPEHGNHILVGSEDPPCDPHVWVEDDTDYNRDFTDQWTTQAMRYGQRVPTLGIPSKMRGVVDLYDASTDWIPIYDRASLPGFYMACGTSGNQYKNAPIAGKMMAALVEYCEGGNDHDTNPLQFTLPYIDTTIDVGFYSRKRPINEESSFSVLG
ncbi:NAD(P)/FAD-dependent oxidoreductase [Oceanibium sediminis]|uniref:NAD(P)/FAD-dependent oxidoreductase n=1 Tax=Oceanibium sediminis TaxID=2026339 RepID=UPI000DD2F538|nr:FAD-dependent oxidoreductase [Oceanibium sediminis]